MLIDLDFILQTLEDFKVREYHELIHFLKGLWGVRIKDRLGGGNKPEAS